MVFVGILGYVLYTIIGVPNSLALGVIAGLTEAVPLLGPWIGGGVAVIAAFLTDPTTALWTALAALAIQQIENHILIPWAMSREAEIHPFVTLFALVFFGQVFGFLGVLLAIPLVLLITTLVEVLWVERAIDTDEDEIAPVVEE
jgi:predicted PurR-regulated permease PerM